MKDMDKQELTHKVMLYNTDFNPYISFKDLNELFNNSLEIRVLELFFSGEEFTVKRIVKELDCWHNSAKRITATFLKLGIIKRQLKGSGNWEYFRLNKVNSNIVKSIMWMLAHTRYRS